MLKGVFKVKAHVKDSPDLSEVAKWEKAGNDAADLAAKKGVAMHPRMTNAERSSIKRQIEIAKSVCALAARLLPEWPKLNLEGVPFSSPVRQTPACEDEPSSFHSWQWSGSFWRCESCLRVKRQSRKPASAGCTGCLPAAVLEIAANDHRCVALACSNSDTLLVCLRCRGFTNFGRMVKLKRQCKPPTKASFQYWNKLQRGLHPTLAGISIEIPPPPSDQ